MNLKSHLIIAGSSLNNDGTYSDKTKRFLKSLAEDDRLKIAELLTTLDGKTWTEETNRLLAKNGFAGDKTARIFKPEDLCGSWNAESRPEPRPLPPLLPEVAAFDWELLPSGIQPWAKDVAKRMSCPPDFLAVGAMVTLGAAVGNALTIRPKAKDSWAVPANLWGAIVAPPSALKTPALAEMIQPLKEIDKRLQTENQEAEQHFETEKEKHKIGLDIAKRSARKHGVDTFELPTAPESPIMKRAIVNNSTSEKLGEIMRDNPRGVLLFRDEVAGWLEEQKKAGREGERGFYLEAYNGTDAFTFDRIGRGTIYIPTACVSVLGGIQPGPFAELMKAEGKAAKADGLLQRFSLLVWPRQDDYVLEDESPDESAQREYRRIIERLFALNRGAEPVVGHLDESSRFPFLRFDSDAYKAFKLWLEKLMNRPNTKIPEAMPEAMVAHLSKYRKALPAIALLCELADKPNPKTVSLESWQKAEAWGEYLESHARRVYAPKVKPEVKTAHKLAKHWEDLPDEFTARDIYRHHWEGLDDAEVVNLGLAVMGDCGWLAKETDRSSGRPKETWKKVATRPK